MRIFFFIFISIVSFSSLANRVESIGTIQKLYTYSEQPGFDGDVAIVVTNPGPGCEGGYWLRKSNTEGYRNTVSFLLSAFHANATVQFGAISTEVWSGSSAKFCRLDQIALI